ncbi:MAG TPA: hypothetical protein VK694_02070 [Verrucomicrobiae bacterium]|nr:hypothetical protein [Verrucomicrobiae bacterium]
MSQTQELSPGPSQGQELDLGPQAMLLDIHLVDDTVVQDTFVRVGHESGAQVLTNDAELFIALQQYGPLAFDERTPGEAIELVTIGISKVTSGLEAATTISMDEANILTLRTSTEVVGVTGDPSEGSVDVTLDRRSFNNPRYVSERLNDATYPHYYAYQSIAEIQQLYADLGFEVTMAGDATAQISFPTPHELKRRLDILRQADALKPEDEKSAIYYPDVEILETGHIDDHIYLSILKQGKFPIGATNFFYFLHDAATDHEQALYEHGEPLMDFMAQYAAAALEDGPLAFSGLNPKVAAGEYDDDKKFSEAAWLADNLTSSLVRRQLDKAPELLREEAPFAERVCDDMVAALKRTGKLGDTQVVAALLKQGVVTTVEEVTGQHIVEELERTARKRFHIEIKVAEQEPDFIDDDF